MSSEKPPRNIIEKAAGREANGDIKRDPQSVVRVSKYKWVAVFPISIYNRRLRWLFDFKIPDGGRYLRRQLSAMSLAAMPGALAVHRVLRSANLPL
jgi:hypothetical protein